MKEVEPEVYLIAETVVKPTDHIGLSETPLPGIGALLEAMGVPCWHTDAPSYGEELMEIMGRLCYRSFAPGLNPNVAKVSEGNEQYVKRIVESKHGSVLEHSSCSFVFRNVSRVFTHELVRHRVGVAISQESLRYVRLDELDFWIPKAFRQHEKEDALNEIVRETVRFLEGQQKLMAQVLDLDNLPFSEKKKLTSAMRRIAPIGLATSIGWTANFRTLRHVIEMRTSRHAEEEARLVFGKVAEICIARYPNVFGDFDAEEVDGYMEWVPAVSKV